MNNPTFVAWTKKNFPQVYRAALDQVHRKVSLGGLGDDLLSDISFDPDTVSASDDIAYDTSNSGNATASGTDWSGVVNSVATAIPAVAKSIVTTDAQLQLINTNAALAAQGKPLQSSLLTPNSLQQNSTLILGLLALGAVVLVMSNRGKGSAQTV